MKKGLITFGLIWIILWSLIGMIRGLQCVPHYKEMQAIAETGDLAKYWDTWSAWKIGSVCHAHAIGLAFIAILIALILPEMHFSDKSKNILGILLIIGIILDGVGEWFVATPITGLGGFLIIAMIIASLIGMLKKS